jgi:hypothetical protein
MPGVASLPLMAAIAPAVAVAASLLAVASLVRARPGRAARCPRPSRTACVASSSRHVAQGIRLIYMIIVYSNLYKLTWIWPAGQGQTSSHNIRQVRTAARKTASDGAVDCASARPRRNVAAGRCSGSPRPHHPGRGRRSRVSGEADDGRVLRAVTVARRLTPAHRVRPSDTTTSGTTA